MEDKKNNEESSSHMSIFNESFSIDENAKDNNDNDGNNNIENQNNNDNENLLKFKEKFLKKKESH